jgi:hypothetical protein
VERAELQLPARLELRAPPALSTLVATVTKLEETRGGAVELSVDGDLGDAQSTWHVHAQLATFVRDVVTAEALFDVGPRRFGAGAEMR